MAAHHDLTAQLAAIVDFAPKLRAAGVSSLSIDGVSMVLHPAAPSIQVETPESDEDQPLPLLEDPESYGLPEGAEVPGFRRPDDLRKA